MSHRKFATPKALIDYAEEKGLVYVWENGRCVRVASPVPAFTKRQQLLSPDQYELIDVRTRSGLRRAMLFPKAILQAEFEANRDALVGLSRMHQSRVRRKRVTAMLMATSIRPASAQASRASSENVAPLSRIARTMRR
jgi:hypothetical protein